ncbi:MAG TPA: AAA family ATPase, partial [Phycisphaerae bacterium]|nr:AAA family ATPase [Phycisphaerae bacterium]
MEIHKANEIATSLRNELGKVIVGQQQIIEQMIIALLAGGHALLEGVPGTAKTLMARALTIASGTKFGRIQFTPDLMPSDILGVNIYNTSTGEFIFRPGPIFADVILADEINRTPAKTQAALLEAMQEHQATIDGVEHPISDVFTVFATQNPVEFEGTYPLPEAQIDRFMLKIKIDYPQESLEAEILDRIHDGFVPTDISSSGLQPVLDSKTLAELRLAVKSVRIETMVRRYITQIIRASRTMRQVSLGASPRAAVMLMHAAQGNAVVAGRDF